MPPKSFAGRTDETRDDWQTPQFIVDELGSFDLDPCANINNPNRLATIGYPVEGLNLPWTGRVWCNPPYGSDCKNWIRQLGDHGIGTALIPPRVGSAWFQELVFDRAHAVLFLRGRVSFLNEQMKPISGNNADSVLIAFGKFDADVLSIASLPGKFWRLR